MHAHTSGTLADLQLSMQNAGIDRSILLPVATKPGQYRGINDEAYRLHETCEETGIDSFGGIHPLDENYKEIISELSAHGIHGIKLHPAYQGVNFDDPKFMRIVGCAAEHDMAITIHPGYDIGLPGMEQGLPSHILPVINEVRAPKLILAHMGGWNCWDLVLEQLAGSDCYFDTSFSINAVDQLDGIRKHYMTNEQFVTLARAHGINKLLPGSDSPWTDQKDAFDILYNCGLTKEEADTISHACLF